MCIFSALQTATVFSAKLPTSSSASVKNGVMQYNQAINNVGGAYDVKDCVFTAPQEGYYVFFWSVTQYNRKYTRSVITKNGAELLNASAYAGDVTYDVAKSSQTVTIHLVPGDRVWIKFKGPQSPYVADPQFSSVFTGFKL